MISKLDEFLYRFYAWLQATAAKKQQNILEKYPPPMRETEPFLSDVDVKRAMKYRRNRQPVEEWT